MAPFKTILIRKKYNPWISGATKEMIKERDRLQKQAAQDRNSAVWRAYKSLRNKIANKLRFEERNWLKSRLEFCAGKSGKMWNNVKNILNWRSIGSPSKLFYKGHLWSKPQDVATVQNEFFLKKIEEIRENKQG